MWKKSLALWIICFLGIVVPLGYVFAQTASCVDNLQVNWPPSPMPGGTDLSKNCELTNLISYLYEWLVVLGGLAVFVALVAAGFQYLTSTGDPQKTKEAMNRIRSAVVGLVLLLSSYLILNTINPRLVVLTPPGEGRSQEPWEDQELKLLDSSPNPCQYVELHRQTDLKDANPLIVGPEPPAKETQYGNISTISTSYKNVQSVSINGDCAVVLYRLPDFGVSADDPPIVFSGSEQEGKATEIENMGIYAGNVFQSVKVLDVSKGEFFCPGPVCLYEDEGFRSENPTILFNSQSFDKPVNTRSVQVKEDHAAVLLQKAGGENRACLNAQFNILDLKNYKDKLFEWYGTFAPISGVNLFKLAEDQTIPGEWIPQLGVKPAILLCGNADCNTNGKEGWTKVITQDILNLTDLGYNDQASSIQIQPGYTAILFKGADYTGGGSWETKQCEVVTETINNFQDINFNNILSSIQVIKGAEIK